MTSLYLPRERNEWFRDREGHWTTSKHEDEVKTYVIDFTDQLDSGETISSATATANGVTVDSGPSLAAGVDGTSNVALSITISKTGGSVELKPVTSSSRTLIKTVQFVGVPDGLGQKDYR